MSFTLGIGVVTYNRAEILRGTIEKVRSLTSTQDTALLVADDGSTDGTLEVLRELGVPYVTGPNMGVAWNKNRALFLLSEILNCETVVLLEDDAQPNAPGWEARWIEAARVWGHVNYAAPWLSRSFRHGSGTATDPLRSIAATAQCAAFSRDALRYAGYFDPRFRGFGHEHVEHTRRLMRSGFGSDLPAGTDPRRGLYLLVESDLTTPATKSYHDAEQVERNRILATRSLNEQGYRAPWGDDEEMRQFRGEIENAMVGADGFAMRVPVKDTSPHLMVETPFFTGIFAEHR